MLKWNKLSRTKRLLIVGSAIALPLVIALPVALASNQAASGAGRILYQGRFFNSYEAAARYVLSQNKNRVSTHQVLGNYNEAMIDATYHTLDKTKLPTFEMSKMRFAYESALGTLTPDLNEARNSYANMGLARQEYTFRGAPTSYYSEKAAEAARESLSGQTQVLGLASLPNPSVTDKRELMHFNAHSAPDLEKVRQTVIKAAPSLTTNGEDHHGWTSENYALEGTLNSGKSKFYRFEDSVSEHPDLDLNNLRNFSEYLRLVVNANPSSIYLATPNGALPENQFRLDLSNPEAPRIVGRISLALSAPNYYDDRDNNGLLDNWKTDTVYDLPFQVMTSGTDEVARFHVNELHDAYNGNHFADRKSGTAYRAFAQGESAAERSLQNLLKTENTANVWMKMQSSWADLKPFVAKAFSGVDEWILGEKRDNFRLSRAATSNQVFLDFANAEFEYNQNSGDAGGMYYRHAFYARSLRNVDVSVPLSGYNKSSNLVSANSFIEFAKKRNVLTKVISYQAKPMYAVKANNGVFDYSSITNISTSIKANEQANEVPNLAFSEDELLVFSGKDTPAAALLSDLAKAATPYRLDASVLETIANASYELTNAISTDALKNPDSPAQNYQGYYVKYLAELVKYIRDFKAANTTDLNWATTLARLLEARGANLVLKPQEILALNSTDLTFKTALLLNVGFNDQLFSSSLSSLILAMTDAAELARQRLRLLPAISECWVFYDQFGGKRLPNDSNALDNSRFDSLELMRKNILAQNSVGIYQGKVFYEGYEQPFTYMLTWIVGYETGGRTIYFLTSNDLLNYVIDQVKLEAVRYL